MSAIEMETIRGDGVTLGELSRNILEMKAEFKGLLDALKEMPARREVVKIEADLKAEHAKDMEALRAEHVKDVETLNTQMASLRADIKWAIGLVIPAILTSIAAIVTRFIE